MEKIITPEDISNIKKLLDSNTNSLDVIYFDDAYSRYKKDYNRVYFHSFLLNFKQKNLHAVYDYLKNNCDFNFYEFLEATPVRLQATDNLDFYVKAIHTKRHDATDSIKNDIIENFRLYTKKDFKAIIRLSLSVKEKKEESFLKALAKKKSFSLTSLEEMELEKLFRNNFSEEIQEKYRDKIFETLPSLINDVVFKEKTGYYYRIGVDTNILSKHNKISPESNYQKVSSLLSQFKNYLSKYNILEVQSFSIGREDNTVCQVTCYFTNDKRIEEKKKYLKEIIDYSLHKDYDPNKDYSQLFSSLFSRNNLENSLERKSDKSHKSNKI